MSGCSACSQSSRESCTEAYWQFACSCFLHKSFMPTQSNCKLYVTFTMACGSIVLRTEVQIWKGSCKSGTKSLTCVKGIFGLKIITIKITLQKPSLALRRSIWYGKYNTYLPLCRIIDFHPLRLTCSLQAARMEIGFLICGVLMSCGNNSFSCNSRENNPFLFFLAFLPATLLRLVYQCCRYLEWSLLL